MDNLSFNQKKMKVLLADDEKDILELVEQSLLKENYEVITAFDGDEAIEKIRSHDPDIILLDLKMPKKGGFDVLKEIRENPTTDKWQPVIIVSASEELEDIQKGYSMEADHYITKPCTASDIIKSIRLMISLIPQRKTGNSSQDG
jgi:DNA-binding response OmpR family regulator